MPEKVKKTNMKLCTCMQAQSGWVTCSPSLSPFGQLGFDDLSKSTHLHQHKQ